MIKLSVVTLVISMISACASAEPPDQTRIQEKAPILENWLLFTSRVNGLDPAQLQLEQTIALKQYTYKPDDDEGRLRLVYLLSRQQLSSAEIDRSQALLANIDAVSAFAPLRDLVREELSLVTELQTKRRQVLNLRTQVGDLEIQLNGLRTQLDALKTIETDLTIDQEELEELEELEE